MNRIGLKAAGPQMTVQALSVVVPARYLDRFGWRTQILHVNALDTPELIPQRAVDRIVGVAAEAGHVRWYAMVLKVLCRDVARVVDPEALAVVLHAMARNAELGLFGTRDVGGEPHAKTDRGEDAQGAKSQNLARGSRRNRGTHKEDGGQHNCQHDQRDEDARYSHFGLPNSVGENGHPPRLSIPGHS